MIKMQLHQIAAIVNSQLVGKDVRIKGVSTDSRTVQPGQLFVALAGEHFDGADYCQQAVEHGAVAVLVSRPVEVSVPQLICDDTQKALAALASAWLQQCQAQVIAITGSNGKTTVKNMLYSVLKQQASVQATAGNYNNEIGLPLTVLALKPETKYLILEMGAGQAGDIAYLCEIAPPNVALVNNISEAHVGRFNGLDAIAKTKGEIYQALQSGGLAVINVDDNYHDSWSIPNGVNQVRFGRHKDADYRLMDNSQETVQVKTSDGQTIHLRLPVAGGHNLMNAAAVVAMAHWLGFSVEHIASGLSHFKPEAGRLQRHHFKQGGLLIDDSYNANPASMQAALSVLQQSPKPRVLVCGDMLELGETAILAHKKVGETAKIMGIENVYAVGDWADAVCQGFGDSACHSFCQTEQLIEALNKKLDRTGTVLVKASRGMRLERIVEALLAESAA
ncbi:UDP-N-acetylmuramoyl-tripeptide--D-alanyl-D-alanine ligase [Marinicella gelatinilytica]|uniref:UDP-N-acetylmuramoyl-tripeptide--D-alanyl-D- alanine ligase n=1 Tax=Marinicella gelatinilytica TaxID=2996017 RepID=UPI002260D9FE|nr:UDP-N-acetylmuramoyl-tripeptide--D-alanyl-D-alanine ligase [Marinicella gelatinilytica]MCX7545153.1 UDP-N-acetylmuramoyl-tripeptide--D-alanyl-D-alanine ligase [Marinicella gelatinilytica]